MLGRLSVGGVRWRDVRDVRGLGCVKLGGFGNVIEPRTRSRIFSLKPIGLYMGFGGVVNWYPNGVMVGSFCGLSFVKLAMDIAMSA